MDPNATWEQLCQADKDQDDELARQLAHDLENWLNKGGFAPEGYDRNLHWIYLVPVIEL